MARSRRFAGLQQAISSAIQASGGADADRKTKTGGDRIMYIECKAGGLQGSARIGRVTFSKTGRTVYYQGLSFQSLKGAGFKSNYCCMETGEDYWISGPKTQGWRRSLRRWQPGPDRCRCARRILAGHPRPARAGDQGRNLIPSRPKRSGASLCTRIIPSRPRPN